LVRRVPVSYGEPRFGKAGVFRYGMVWHGSLGYGRLWQARLGMAGFVPACFGLARQRMAGEVWLVWARLGLSGHREAGTVR